MKIEQFGVENIIFDLGGVILDIDIKTAIDNFIKMGISPNQNELNPISSVKLFMDYEVGAISSQDFKDEISKIAKTGVSNEDFINIWNAIILNYPAENIKILEEIKSNYRTFLMSNTNEMHHIHYSNILRAEYGFKSLDELFEKAYFSHISKMRKPEIRFFELLINENKLNPEKTLFIDDFIENIEAAKLLGIKTLHLSDGMKLKDYF
jgi:putative hydrolase of the HAD superfamily